MLNKKNIIVHLLSLCVLCISFVMCRYVFFDIHGMKQLPIWLFVVGMVSMAVSFFLKGKTIPICTAVAYIVGFIAGVLFQTNGLDAGGGTTNNLWIIWSTVFICLILIGIISEKMLIQIENNFNKSKFAED